MRKVSALSTPRTLRMRQYQSDLASPPQSGLATWFSESESGSCGPPNRVRAGYRSISEILEGNLTAPAMVRTKRWPVGQSTVSPTYGLHSHEQMSPPRAVSEDCFAGSVN